MSACLSEHSTAFLNALLISVGTLLSRHLVALLIETSGTRNCTFVSRCILEYGFVTRECLLALAQLLISFGARRPGSKSITNPTNAL
jgi:hypothetical protein